MDDCAFADEESVSLMDSIGERSGYRKNESFRKLKKFGRKTLGSNVKSSKRRKSVVAKGRGGLEELFSLLTGKKTQHFDKGGKPRKNPWIRAKAVRVRRTAGKYVVDIKT
jgi:hypothetical protein